MQRRATTGVSRALTQAFVDGHLDLSARSGAPAPGWSSMPEVRAIDHLRSRGAEDPTVRTFLTLVAAVDRARDADRLWDAAAVLYDDDPWVYVPSDVATRPLTELADALRRQGVTQRHGHDTFAWRTICESLLEDSPVRAAIEDGEGDAPELLAAVKTATPGGSARYPLLRGEKIATMWVRLLAHPGDAAVANLEQVPVAVDVQVRKVTEYLGVADTHTMELDKARPLIQRAWHREVAEYGAVGPPRIDGTCSALDPALWFFAKWGCTTCERAGQRRPVHEICSSCRFDQLRSEAGA